MIILDTHAWLWLVSDPSRLGQAAVEAIDGADDVGVSAISCWEIAMLVVKGRVSLGRPTLEWLEQSLSNSRMMLVPINPTIDPGGDAPAARRSGRSIDRGYGIVSRRSARDQG